MYADYERSSWRYMNDERGFQREDSEAFKIGNAPHRNYDITEPYLIGKDGGSAYGGEWKPSKPDDDRFVGKPGDISRTADRNGNL